MAKVDPIEIPLGGGLDNRSYETKLPAGSLREAENVDIGHDGRVRRRDGYTLSTSGVCHSLWSHEALNYALLVKDGKLCRMEQDATLTELTSILANKLSYAYHAGQVYYCSPLEAGRVDADGAAATFWGLPDPDAPAVTALASGGLEAGEYQVGITYVSSTGIESGCPFVSLVDVADGGGLQVTLPTSVANVSNIHIYVSQVNGSILYRAATAPMGIAQWNIGVGQRKVQLKTQFMRRPPGGSIVRSYLGRLYVASGNVIYFTEAMNPHVYHPMEGFFQFAEDITLMEPVENGIYVAYGGRTVWLNGDDPKDMSKTLISNYGAVQGTSAWLPGGTFSSDSDPAPRPSVCWWDTNGVLQVGRPGGRLVPQTDNSYRAAPAAEGTALYREVDGIKQVLAVLRGEGTGAYGVATDEIVTEVRRGGIVLDS